MTLTAPTPTANYGEIFTRRWVVDVLLDITGYTADRDLGALHLLEPSCGSGAFLGPAVERLISSARSQGRDLALLGDAVRAYDLQSEHVKTARRVCHDLLAAAGLPGDIAITLAKTWVRHQDFLLPGVDGLPADVAIGNPPYIRYDDLDADTATEYRRAWTTMKGRGDIYVGFYERCLAMLKPGGRVGFICADRWMRNQYGVVLRDLVSSRYSVQHVWTMHDVDAFESAVSAYPAITVLANEPQGTSVVAETTAAFGESSAQALAKWSRDESLTHFTDDGVRAHRLPHWFPPGEMWPTGSPARLALIERLNDGFASLHDEATGTRVSIGIATGADKAYVTKDADAAEPDRMLPLSMRRDLMSGSFEWQGNYLVNPWDADGNLVDLADYPRLAAHLSAHPAIKDRFVAKKNPDRWHRTIDKVNASIIDRPKLLLQDMKAHIHPVLERGGHYPHHNLYYVVSETWDMEVLGGILLSRIAQAFIEAYCVRMRGGTLRFQAQYLKKIRVPAPTAISGELADDLRRAFRVRDVEAATSAAARAYGIDILEYELTDTVPNHDA
ncbi:Eco57I restriction-modification methylase domain-containing protein [Amycolatopsis sp. Hca4]|uniref:Eco57I restriction-modification methylase domain-containing protein n=1 Tax=unclassified Amycolatopsis TaxID=2618356 RepID=UPI0015911AFF|nr:Eco57I restriction-modification methylase domain-containing protein [Amycolatopsis sp. Hca4]QKV78025.1 Eco57I restriction-modification methylase domain-containing protein [Amycolatopsis sp. Hca4]